LNKQTGKDGMGCQTLRRGSSESCSTRLLGEQMISCRVSRREHKTRQGKLPGHLLARPGWLPQLPAVRLLRFQVVLLGRGEDHANGRVAVVDLWCKANAVLVLPPLMSHLQASEAGDWGAESGEVNNRTPRQTRRMMAQAVVACDWSHGYVFGICLAEKIWKAVGGSAGRIEDTCLLHCCVPSIRLPSIETWRHQTRGVVYTCLSNKDGLTSRLHQHDFFPRWPRMPCGFLARNRES
jgi:hypothetical protein